MTRTLIPEEELAHNTLCYRPDIVIDVDDILSYLIYKQIGMRTTTNLLIELVTHWPVPDWVNNQFGFDNIVLISYLSPMKNSTTYVVQPLFNHCGKIAPIVWKILLTAWFEQIDLKFDPWELS